MYMSVRGEWGKRDTGIGHEMYKSNHMTSLRTHFVPFFS